DIPKADDAQALRPEYVYSRRGRQTSGEILREREVALDDLPVATAPVFLECHPCLERAKGARLLESEFAEPWRTADAIQIAIGAQIGRDETEYLTHDGGVTDEDQPRFDGNEQPFVRIDRHAVTAGQWIQLVPISRAQNGRCSISAVHVQPDAVARTDIRD